MQRRLIPQTLELASTMDTLPYKATITINIEGQNPDEFGVALQNATDSLSLGSSGNGITKNGTRYDYKVESNIPASPMTLNRLLGLLDDHVGEEDRQALRDLWGTEHLHGQKPE